MDRTLRLGTRRSALAWAQSLWVADRIRELNPDLAIELVPIETQGDRITHIPLREMEGKAFFTAELDLALLDKRVDLTVHSLKDLSLERPQGIHLAAIPARENPRDVVVFRGDAPQRLSAGQTLRIGTSAPRRLENVPKFLKWALPQIDKTAPRPEFMEIRGNVDTRLSRLHEPDGSDRQLDGVVLAFAGLIRLWRDTRSHHDSQSRDVHSPSGRERLTSLLQNTRWMVLPFVSSPTAPGQGALAVECREEDTQLRALLSPLNDAQTTRQIQAERAVLARFGGGCHQAFGATCVTHPACGDVLYIRGKAEDRTALNSMTWLALPPKPTGKIVAWNGLRTREIDKHGSALSRAIEETLEASRAPVFIAHSRALPLGIEATLEGRRVWTSGVSSWDRLAERGVWVEGCADALGFNWISPTLDEPVLQLPALEEWQILTHAAAVETWRAGQVLATYPGPEWEAQIIEDAAAITHVYWASGTQFSNLYSQLPPTVHHACGPGKTADLIRDQGIEDLAVFPSNDEWQRWIQTGSR